MSEPKQVEADNVKEPTREEKVAELTISPTISNAYVVSSTTSSSSSSMLDVAFALKKQIDKVVDGSMTRPESILVAQAHSLDALFCELTQRAMKAQTMPKLEAYLRLGLKAQSQCRATLQTLGELKAPKQLAFVQQANIGNQVQVNNGTEGASKPVRARTRKTKKNAQNELLEVEHGQRLDTRTTSAASPVNSELEAVGEQHRAAHGRG